MTTDNMNRLGVLFLLVAGVVASPIDVGEPKKVEPKDQMVAPEAPITSRCTLNVDHGIVIQGVQKPVYICSSETGDMLLAVENMDPVLDAVVEKETISKIHELSRTPKRRGGFGGGFGGFGGRPGYGGGGFGGAQSSSSAFGGGGGCPGCGGGGFAQSQSSAGGFGFGR